MKIYTRKIRIFNTELSNLSRIDKIRRCPAYIRLKHKLRLAKVNAITKYLVTQEIQKQLKNGATGNQIAELITLRNKLIDRRGCIWNRGVRLLTF